MDHIREENDDDVNVDYDKFHKHFLKTLDKYAPMKTVSKRERKQKLKPWIAKGMKLMSKIDYILDSSKQMTHFTTIGIRP